VLDKKENVTSGFIGRSTMYISWECSALIDTGALSPHALHQPPVNDSAVGESGVKRTHA
jgi:hypothetical protein